LKNNSLLELARCRSEFLRERLIDKIIEEKWTSTQIRTHASALNYTRNRGNEDYFKLSPSNLRCDNMSLLGRAKEITFLTFLGLWKLLPTFRGEIPNQYIFVFLEVV